MASLLSLSLISVLSTPVHAVIPANTLTLTPAGTALGFTLTPIITGIPTVSQPWGTQGASSAIASKSGDILVSNTDSDELRVYSNSDKAKGSILKSKNQIIGKAAIVEKSNKGALAPVIRFGILDPQQIPHLQLEAALAERRLRELAQKVLRLRPQDKTQAEKLSSVLGIVEAEIAETTKLRIALASVARLGSELTAEDQKMVKTLVKWVQTRIENPEITSKGHFELELRVLKAFLLEE